MEKNSTRSWIICIVVTLACAAAFMANMKYSVGVNQLMEQFDVSLTTSSMIITAFNLAGIFMAIPGGALCAKLGPKNTILIGLACLAIGAVGSIFSAGYVMFLVFRLIEGIGNGFMMVLGPGVMAYYFTSDKVGMPMGIQGCWTAIGALIALNLAVPMMNLYGGWQGMWWFTVAYDVAMMVLVFIVLPKDDVKADAARAQETGKKPSYMEIFKNPAVWLLALIMLGYTFASGALNNFSPKYLMDAAGYTAADANLVSSLNPIGKIVGSLICGAILLKVKNRSKFLFVMLCVVLCLSLVVWTFNEETPRLLIPTFFLVCGGLFLFVPPTVNSTVPTLFGDPRYAGVAMGVVITIQNIGNTFSGNIQSAAVEAMGSWFASAIVVGVAMAIAIIACFFLVRILSKSKAEQQNAQ